MSHDEMDPETWPTLHERLLEAVDDGPEEDRVKSFARFLIKALIENSYHMRDHELAFVADKVAMSLRMGTLTEGERENIRFALKSVGLGAENNG